MKKQTHFRSSCVPSPMVQLRRSLAILGLFAFACMWGYETPRQTGWMILCGAVFALGDALCAFALLRGWFWARWAGLGIGLVGTLNVIVWFAMDRGAMYVPAMMLQGVAFPSLLLLLCGRRMAACYDEKPSPHNHWRFTAWPVRLLSWAVVLNIATAPMLLLHACVDPAMPLSRRLFVIGAGVLTTFSVAQVIGQRSVGLLLMCAAGLATMAIGYHSLPGLFGCACGEDRYQMMVEMTAVTVFPAGMLGAFASMVAFARPMLRFVRR